MGNYARCASRIGLAVATALLAPCLVLHPAPLPRVAVRVVASGIDPSLVEQMFRELVSTWRGGIEVLPYSEDLAPPPVTTGSVILAPGRPPAAAEGALGWIHFVASPNAAPAPVLMVSLAATRALIEQTVYRGMPVAQRPAALRQALLARALGRAAAHELGHYLLASSEHSRGGLMRARFDASDLVAEAASAFHLDAT